MIGMAFDVESPSPSKSIQPYEVNTNKLKGAIFMEEPYLTSDLSLSDFSKDKDTMINGQQCFLVKRNKVIQNTFRGKQMEKVVKFRLAINPSLKAYSFPFISEKIVQYFGGGAIVYIDGETESGNRSSVNYNYAGFTPREESLFNHYQALYEVNTSLLDQLKKKN